MRTRPPRWIPTIVLLTSLCCALAGCGADLYIIFEQFELSGDERIPHGAGCASVMQRDGILGGASSSSGIGSSSGDLTVEEGEQGDRYVVVVSSFGEELAHRAYDREFLKSRKVDRFEVTTKLGKRFEFSYQGSKNCETPPSFGGAPDDEQEE